MEEALAGARDIMAECIADDAAVRRRLRVVCMANGYLTSKAAKEEDSVYSNYYNFREPLNKVPGHRILAINRGEREDYLKVRVEFDEAHAMRIIASEHLRPECPATQQVRLAAEDSYDRLIFPALGREIRNALTDAASEAAIRVFSVNLRQLLMQPPVKGRVTLGLDPGYQHGCKTAVIDGTGKVLDTGIVYPVPQFKRLDEAKRIISGFIRQYHVQTIAIGNGTASHETEVFVADLLREMGDSGAAYMVVSEAGASVYSASKLAAQEFPDYDVNLRSAVSIARRLQDPLAELVKIDPKAIGVGQYQHDLPQAHLSEALGGVVESCVNAVGVDLNTASAPLLEQVAGINAAVARSIVAYREENGAFTSRAQLKKVPKLGPKAFEQCAGFLRVPESKNLLDHTAVHPESYAVAQKLLEYCGLKPASVSALQEKVDAIGLPALAERLEVGEPTLVDIVAELQHPGRDPRDELPQPLLRTDILGIESLKPGMELTGTVRNVVDFGAFVDIGVHEDGLVHISQITNRYIKHPSEVLKVGDIVKTWVLTVDVEIGGRLLRAFQRIHAEVVILLVAVVFHAGGVGDPQNLPEIEVACAKLRDLPVVAVQRHGLVLQVQDINAAGQLFNPFQHIAAGMLHPVGIQHKGGILRVKFLYQNIHDGLPAMDAGKFARVVVVGELHAVVAELFCDAVHALDQVLQRGIIEAFIAHAGHAAGAGVGGAEDLVDAHGLLRILQQIKPQMGADHPQAGILCGLGIGFYAEAEGAGSLDAGIAVGGQLLEGICGLLGGLHGIAHGIDLNAQFFFHGISSFLHQ